MTEIEEFIYNLKQTGHYQALLKVSPEVAEAFVDICITNALVEYNNKMFIDNSYQGNR